MFLYIIEILLNRMFDFLNNKIFNLFKEKNKIFKIKDVWYNFEFISLLKITNN